MPTVLISGQVVNVSDEEKKIYELLLRDFGRDAFNGLIKTNEDKDISAIDLTQNTKVSFSIMYFLITLSVNQRLNKIDEAVASIRSLEDRVSAIEFGVNRPKFASTHKREPRFK